MSELTYTIFRLGLLVLLWVFVLSLAAVLRRDIYGTRVSNRAGAGRGGRRPAPAPAPRPPAPAAAAAAAGAGAQASQRQPRRRRPPTTLVVTDGQMAGTSLPLGRQEVLVGRSPECTLVIDDEFASGRHLRIFPRAEGWFVEDLGSRNGTVVGGVKITGAVPVESGSVVKVGRTTLELRDEPMAIALRYAARTDLGLGPKSRNEDSGYAGPHLLVLADGMGGHAAGDVASSLIVGQLAPLDGESIGAEQALPTLERSVREANRRLRAAMDDDPKLRGMGSTTIAMLRSGNKLAMAHIGDSRAYLLRDGKLSQITKDHSFVQQLVDEERITPEEAEDHPQRSLVTRVMTGQADDEPDLSMRELRAGDRYLLCSDGLSDFVRRDIIEEILTDASSPSAAADRLIEVALKASARDNVTVVVADGVDLRASEAPSTAPQIVGAASLRDREGKRTRGLPISPAEKAAQLTRSTRAPEPDEDGPALADEPRSKRVIWVRRTLVAAAVALVLVGTGYAAYAWSQNQYFVKASDGYVGVWRGVDQTLGPIRLSHVDTVSDVPLSDLPTYVQDLVRAGTPIGSKADADARMTTLRQTAVDCRAQAAGGTPCGQVPVILPTPTTTTSATSATSPASGTATLGTLPLPTVSAAVPGASVTIGATP